MKESVRLLIFLVGGGFFSLGFSGMFLSAEDHAKEARMAQVVIEQLRSGELSDEAWYSWRYSFRKAERHIDNYWYLGMIVIGIGIVFITEQFFPVRRWRRRWRRILERQPSD